jgi:hypothetical protein
MKRIMMLLAVVVTVVALLVVGCAGEEEEEGERTVITLDFGTFWGVVDFQAKGSVDMYGYTDTGHEAWMNTISALVLARTTDYEIKWNKSYSVPPPDLLPGVVAGTYDVMASGPGYTAGVFPLWEGPEYPAELNRMNAYTMSMQLQALYEEFEYPAGSGTYPLQDEMTAQNIKVMHFWSTGPGYFLMTAGNDVTELADFPGKTIRAANPASVDCINALGAEPLAIGMSGALEKFEAGLIQGILCPTDTPEGFGLGAYVRNGTFCPFSYHFVFMKVMNLATWNGLPAEVQAIFNEVNAKWPEYYGKLRTWGEEHGKQYCLNEIEGFTMYYIADEDPEEYAAWCDLMEPLITEWIGGDAKKQALWDKFVALDAEMTETYGDWTPGTAPPPVPTFP